MKIEQKVNIEIPSLPNFLRSKDGHTVIPVSSLTKEQLQKIGELWLKAFIKKSKRK